MIIKNKNEKMILPKSGISMQFFLFSIKNLTSFYIILRNQDMKSWGTNNVSFNWNLSFNNKTYSPFMFLSQ